MKRGAQILESVVLDREILRQYPNVQSVGIGFKERGGELSRTLCVKVHVRRKAPKSRLSHVIPERWPILVPVGRGLYRRRMVKTDVVKVPSVRHAGPVGAGVEIGRAGWDPGTVCCVVQKSGSLGILTAAHVFARAMVDGPPAGTVRVYQPDEPDDDSNLFGAVADAYYGNDPTQGFIDAAVVARRVKSRAITLDVAGRPGFTGVASSDAWVGPVAKVGAVTGYREATFSMTHDRVTIGTTEAVHVLEYLSTSDDAFARPGDSGSAVFTNDGAPRVIGMLIAIADSGRRGLVVPLQRILDHFTCKLAVG